ncbi:hypothetical protein MKW98_006530, partial [Papaver atlanticum]
ENLLQNLTAGSGSSSRSAPHHKYVPIATSSSIAAKAPAIKFSNDTERLIYETREAFTAEQINEVCYVDAINNMDIFNALTNNPKVFYNGKRFSYKEISCLYICLHMGRKFPQGKKFIDLKDAYPAVLDDLQL